jgi:hypothetical protein
MVEVVVGDISIFASMEKYKYIASRLYLKTNKY